MIRHEFEIDQLSPDDYLALVDSEISHRRPIPAPRTAGQLETLLIHYPERAAPFRPPQAELQRLGLSRYAGGVVPPFDVEFKERFLSTLTDDDEFCGALRILIGGAE